jgi:hypothetical protein
MSFALRRCIGVSVLVKPWLPPTDIIESDIIWSYIAASAADSHFWKEEDLDDALLTCMSEGEPNGWVFRLGDDKDEGFSRWLREGI